MNKLLSNTKSEDIEQTLKVLRESGFTLKRIISCLKKWGFSNEKIGELIVKLTIK